MFQREGMEMGMQCSKEICIGAEGLFLEMTREGEREKQGRG